MVNQQLIDYIKHEQQQGKSREDIVSALHSQGWQQADIDQGFASAASGAPATPMPMGQALPKAKQIFSDSWRIYKSHFKTLIILSAIPTISFAIVGLMFAGGAVAGTALKLNIQALGILGLLVALVAIIFLIYLSIWSAVALLFAVKDPAESLSWIEAYKRSKPKVNEFFSTNLLSGLATIGGFLLLIIPGIIFALWFSQSSYVVVEENLQNSAALKRSKYYITGRLGEVFGKFFFIGIITLAVYIAVGLIISPFGSKEGNPASFVTNIISILWTPLTVVYGYQLYKHLKATRP